VCDTESVKIFMVIATCDVYLNALHAAATNHHFQRMFRGNKIIVV